MSKPFTQQTRHECALSEPFLFTWAPHANTAAEITSLWNSSLHACHENPPLDDEVCSPQHLLESLAKEVIAAGQSPGMHGFDQQRGEQTTSSLPAWRHEAWNRFLTDSQHIHDWEPTHRDALVLELDDAGIAPITLDEERFPGDLVSGHSSGLLHAFIFSGLFPLQLQDHPSPFPESDPTIFHNNP